MKKNRLIAAINVVVVEKKRNRHKWHQQLSKQSQAELNDACVDILKRRHLGRGLITPLYAACIQTGLFLEENVSRENFSRWFREHHASKNSD